MIHTGGVVWDEAPLPPWRHKCRAASMFGCVPAERPADIGHVHILWCACGGWIWPGLKRWQLRNNRRINSPYARTALWCELFAGYDVWRLFEHSSGASYAINGAGLLLMVALGGHAAAKTGGRSWNGKTPPLPEAERRGNG